MSDTWARPLVKWEIARQRQRQHAVILDKFITQPNLSCLQSSNHLALSHTHSLDRLDRLDRSDRLYFMLIIYL